MFEALILVLAPLQAPQAPPPLDPGMARFQALVATWSEAVAVDLRFEAISKQDGTWRKFRGSLRAAKPLHGAMNVEQNDAPNFELVADGTRVAALDRSNGRAFEYGRDLAVLTGMLPLYPVQAWAGVDAPASVKVTRIESDPPLPLVEVLRIESAEQTTTLWIDHDDRLVAAEFTARFGDEVLEQEYLFTRCEWSAAADPADFAASIPAGLELVEDTFVDFEAGLLAVGDAAPEVVLTGMDGARYPLESFRGRTVLLNFWFYH